MRRKPKEPMLRSYGFWSYSNMRLYLTYFPLFIFLTFYVKSTLIAGEHTDYELNLKRKKDPKTNMKCYKFNKIGIFKIQREIETRKIENYYQNDG